MADITAELVEKVKEDTERIKQVIKKCKTIEELEMYGINTKKELWNYSIEIDKIKYRILEIAQHVGSGIHLADYIEIHNEGKKEILIDTGFISK